MRRSGAEDYVEERDALSRQWPVFLAWCLPEASWTPAPNLGDASAAWARDWGIGGLIVTGGDDIGVDPVRDRSERALLAQAEESRWPVFGVCRGFQLMNLVQGGSLERIAAGGHVATRHALKIEGLAFASAAPVTANSYHSVGIGAAGLARSFRPEATTEDGWIEAASDVERRWLGVMWHPERERPFAQFDRDAVRRHFLNTAEQANS